MRGPLHLGLLLVPAALAAQPSLAPGDVRPGTEAFHYAQAMALVESPGPWMWDSAAPALRWRQSRLTLGLNSDLPFNRENGAAWAGKGPFLQLDSEARAAWGPLTVRLAPMLWWSRNADFTLVPTGTANPYADPQRPLYIDLPQRFGEGAIARLDPGASEIAIAAFHLRAALTSAPRLLGPGPVHTALMQPDGGGYPRLELGTDERGLATPVGTFLGTISAGQVAQSAFAPERRVGSRSASFLEGRWRPLRDERVELGIVRFYHQDWQGARINDLIAPLGSVFFDPQIFDDGDPDNQLASLFARLRVPSAGLEVYGEFVRNDRSADLRDLTIELEHNAAWLVGAQHAWVAGAATLWSVQGVVASGRIPPIQVFRPQATLFEHTPITQGHTVRGQLLGSWLLERTGGAELRVDRWDAHGRAGLRVASRALPNVQALAVPSSALRQEWSFVGEMLRWQRRGAVTASVAAVFDAGRHPTRGDGRSLSASVGYLLFH